MDSAALKPFGESATDWSNLYQLGPTSPGVSVGMSRPRQQSKKPRATSEIPYELDERLQAFCRERQLGRAYAVRQALEKFLTDEGYPPNLPLRPTA